MGKPFDDGRKLIAFPNAVAGHKGVLCTEDGDTFIKPATLKEIAFYDAIQDTEKYPGLADLCPTYYGSLEFTPEHIALIDSVSQESYSLEETPGAGHHELGKNEHDDKKDPGTSAKLKKITHGIALEALTHGFKEPNTLDVKLGAILYDDIAKTQGNWGKIAKFRKISEDTTSRNWGFRFAGMHVFQGHEVQRNTKTPPVNRDGFRTYGKNWGQNLQDGDVHDAFREYLFEPKAGVDAELGAYVAEAFLSELRKMIEVLENIELRMYSASILFVYEGDGDRLRKAITEQIRLDKGGEPKVMGKDEDGDPVIWDPKVFKCKLIDFAHATIGREALAHHAEPEEVNPELGLQSKVTWDKCVGGEKGPGKDENALKGIRNVAKILEEVKDKGPLTKSQSDLLTSKVDAREDAKLKTKVDDDAEIKRVAKNMEAEYKAAYPAEYEAEKLAREEALDGAEASKVNGTAVNGTKRRKISI